MEQTIRHQQQHDAQMAKQQAYLAGWETRQVSVSEDCVSGVKRSRQELESFAKKLEAATRLAKQAKQEMDELAAKVLDLQTRLGPLEDKERRKAAKTLIRIDERTSSSEQKKNLK
jgi:chromosome segregation ATPase